MQLDSNLSEKDWFGTGTNIPSESDLDTYITPGKYFCNSVSISKTLVNSPVTGDNFAMYVFHRTSGGKSINQLIITLNGELYIRGSNSSGSFREWKQKANKSELTDIINQFDNYLSIYGGTLTGNLHISSISPLIILDSGESYTKLIKNASSTIDYGTNLIDYCCNREDNSTLRIFYDAGSLSNKIAFIDTTDGVSSIYKMYGEHNITKSTTDLVSGSSPLETGCIHIVYE